MTQLRITVGFNTENTSKGYPQICHFNGVFHYPPTPADGKGERVRAERVLETSSSSRPGSCNRFALNRIQKGRQASGQHVLEVVPSFSSMVFRCGEKYVVEACSTSSSSTSSSSSSSSRKQEEKVAKIIFFYGFQKLH